MRNGVPGHGWPSACSCLSLESPRSSIGSDVSQGPVLADLVKPRCTLPVDPLRRSVCAAGQPASSLVGGRIGLSARDRRFPPFTGLSGTRRAHRIRSRTTVGGSAPGSGEDSVYRDGDRWRGAVSLGYDEHGNRLRKKVSGRTRTEVVEKLRKLHQQVDSGVVPDDRLTVQAFLDR